MKNIIHFAVDNHLEEPDQVPQQTSLVLSGEFYKKCMAVFKK